MACIIKTKIEDLFVNEEKVIDREGNILNQEKFVELNTEYSQYAIERFKIPIAGSIYTLVDGKAVIDEHFNEYMRDSEVMFSPSEEDGGYSSDFEKYIHFKKNLLHRLQERLQKIKRFKTDAKDSPKELRALINEEAEIKKRIEGVPDKDGNENGLLIEIETLENSASVFQIEYFAEKDFSRLDTLSSSNDIEDIHEAKSIINFYKEFGNFRADQSHPIFESNQIHNSKGELILPEELKEIFEKIAEKAEKEYSKVYQKEKRQLVSHINSNSKIENTYRKNLTYEDVTGGEDGIKDTSWVDMFIMDTTNGIFSKNGVIPQVMLNTLQDNIERNMVEAKKIEARVAAIQEALTKELTVLGYKIKIPGVSGVVYDLFRAKDAKGNFKDAIVEKYSYEYTKALREMKYKYGALMGQASKTIDKDLRSELFEEAYLFRDNWLRKNTFVLDLKKLQGTLRGDTVFTVEEQTYLDEIEGHLGEDYTKEIEKQKQLINEYKVAKEVYSDNLIVKEGVASESRLSTRSKNLIREWELKNDPLAFSESFYGFTPIKNGDFKVNSTTDFNSYYPRQKQLTLQLADSGDVVGVESKEDSGYYDKDYKTIAKSPVLKEFHNILEDTNKLIYDSLPAKVAKGFNSNSIPALTKSLIEIMSDPNMSLYQRISKTFRKALDNIAGMFGVANQTELSHAMVDPITGKPSYQVTQDFLKTNSKEIKDRLFIESVRLKEALNTMFELGDNKYTSYNLDRVSKEVLEIMGDNLGVPADLVSIKKRLGLTEGQNMAQLGLELENAITHQVVSEQSFDLPKLIKLFSHQAMMYKARQESLPILEILKEHYNSMKTPSTNKFGNAITNAVTRRSRIEGERLKGNIQMESWFNRVVLGDYSSKVELGDTRLKNTGMTPDGEKKSFLQRITPTITGKIKTSQEKKQSKKIDALLEIYPKHTKLIEMKEGLGKHFSGASTFDAFFNFIRTKSLGWNLGSSVTNFMEGQIANIIIAATGEYFTPENIYRATHIVKGSFFKNFTPEAWEKFGATTGARKLSVLMARYEVLQDAANELQKASVKSTFSKFEKLSPYELTKRTEYLNQAPLMIAVLLDTKVKDITGMKETSVWDAMDAEGNFKEEFRTEENIATWERLETQELFDFKSKVTKTIVNAHGDYHNLRGNLASEYVTGKALLMFKRWMARQFYQRFAMVEQDDIETGVKAYKGRYLTHTSASGLLHGAIVGFGGLSLVGAGITGIGIGAAAGYALGRFAGENTGMNFAKELALMTKELMLTMLRIPVNQTMGRNVIKSNFFEKLDKTDLNKRAKANMGANMADMALTLSWLGLTLFAKGLLWDDEDEKDSTKRQTHNYFVNMFMQLSSQAAMYVDITDAYSNTVGNLAVLRFLKEVGDTMNSFEAYVMGDDTLASGKNAGKSKFVNNFKKTFFLAPMKTGLGFGVRAERQWKKSPFDEMFYGDEKIAKKMARKRRSTLRRELQEQGYNKKEVTKAVNKKYPAKKPKQTYRELLEEYDK